MLIFHCTNCKEMINGADDERADQIFDRLEAHITKCPLATLPSRERRTLPGRELTIYEHSLRTAALRVSCGYKLINRRSFWDKGPLYRL